MLRSLIAAHDSPAALAALIAAGADPFGPGAGSMGMLALCMHAAGGRPAAGAAVANGAPAAAAEAEVRPLRVLRALCQLAVLRGEGALAACARANAYSPYLVGLLSDAPAEAFALLAAHGLSPAVSVDGARDGVSLALALAMAGRWDAVLALIDTAAAMQATTNKHGLSVEAPASPAALLRLDARVSLRRALAFADRKSTRLNSSHT